MLLCCPSDSPEVAQEGLSRVTGLWAFLARAGGVVAPQGFHLSWSHLSGRKGLLPRDMGWGWS